MDVRFEYEWKNRSLIYTIPYLSEQRFVMKAIFEIYEPEAEIHKAVYKQLYYHSNHLYKVVDFIYSI
jgi:hypothetical protein